MRQQILLLECRLAATLSAAFFIFSDRHLLSFPFYRASIYYFSAGWWMRSSTKVTFPRNSTVDLGKQCCLPLEFALSSGTRYTEVWKHFLKDTKRITGWIGLCIPELGNGGYDSCIWPSQADFPADSYQPRGSQVTKLLFKPSKFKVGNWSIYLSPPT